MDPESVVEEVLERGEVDLYRDSAEFYDLTYSEAMSNGNKERIAQKYLDERDRVLDLACGTGIVTERLEDDYNMTGADISREMLEVARNKDLESEFIQADMTDLPFEEEFDAILMYGQPFSHLESAGKVESAAKSIYNALNTDGILVTDVFRPKAGKEDNIKPLEMEAGGYSISMLPKFTNYNEEARSWDGSIRFKIQNENSTRVLEDRRQFRGYSMSQLEKIIHDAGFEGIEEERIFASDLNHGFIAHKGLPPETSNELGFFISED